VAPVLSAAPSRRSGAQDTDWSSRTPARSAR